DTAGTSKLLLSVEWNDNADKMTADFAQQPSEMYERMGFKNINVVDRASPPGSDIHEMGGVRMGNDPKTSLLNKYNQLHHCKNVFVTDGACMTSGSTQNPTLTFRSEERRVGKERTARRAPDARTKKTTK